MRCLTDVFDHWLKENTEQKHPSLQRPFYLSLENALANDLEEYIKNELQDQETNQEIDSYSIAAESEIEHVAENEISSHDIENVNPKQQEPVYQHKSQWSQWCIYYDGIHKL